MSLRHKLTLGGLIAFVVCILVPIIHGRRETIDDLFLHLASEIVGIIITVAVIDKLLERERGRDDVCRHSWRFLCAIDHAVWVWQGGRRALDVGELLDLLSKVEDKDPVPSFTEDLFLHLANEADEVVKGLASSDIFGVSSDLQNGLEAIARIVVLHDGNELTPRHLALEIEDAVKCLSKTITLGRSSFRNQAKKDCSEESQKKRYDRWFKGGRAGDALAMHQ